MIYREFDHIVNGVKVTLHCSDLEKKLITLLIGCELLSIVQISKSVVFNLKRFEES